MMDKPESGMIVAWRFALVVVPTVLVLGVVNALPQFLGGDPLGIVRYDTVERLEARHGVAIWRPTALPAPWAWPPSRVQLAVGRPDWVEFLFPAAARGDEALVLCQTIGSPDIASRTLPPRWLASLDDRRDPRRGLLAGVPGDAGPPPGPDVPTVLLPAGEPLQASDIPIDDRIARMRRLLLADGSIVHEVWWREGRAHVMLRLRGSAESLPRIARTIFGTRP
jgi:hypothetical protein